MCPVLDCVYSKYFQLFQIYGHVRAIYDPYMVHTWSIHMAHMGHSWDHICDVAMYGLRHRTTRDPLGWRCAGAGESWTGERVMVVRGEDRGGKCVRGGHERMGGGARG